MIIRYKHLLLAVCVIGVSYLLLNPQCNNHLLKCSPSQHLDLWYWLNQHNHLQLDVFDLMELWHLNETELTANGSQQGSWHNAHCQK